jgi:Domain of unknown function (DUF4091)/IPT/TIG domain/FG-GAP-like repeat
MRRKIVSRLSVWIVSCFVVGASTTLVTVATTSTAPAVAGAATVQTSCLMTAGTGLPTKSTGGTTNGTINVLDTLAQVLPTHEFAGASSATLCAARDDYASFQVEVAADQGTALQNVAMTASNLVGPGGAVIPGTASGATSDIQFDREEYVTLTRLSDGELDPSATSPDTVTPSASRVARVETTGACSDTADSCRFPDELIPDRDSVYGETRNAFQSLTIPAGENRVAWVDVFVPTGTTPGTYAGTVTVTQSTGTPTTVPVTLQVISATLPATSTTDSAFFYEHPNTDPTGFQAAAELGLDDRISVVPDGIVGGAGPQAILAPLLDGTAPTTAGVLPVKLQDSGGRYAALTDLPMPADQVVANGTSLQAYKPLFTAATTAKPWAYCDESGYVACDNDYNANVAPIWSGLPLLSIDDPETGTTDAWPDPETQVVPSQLSSIIGGVVDLQQFIDPAEGWLPPNYVNDTSDRSKYLTAWAAAAPGRQAWSYLTNESGSGPYNPTQARYVGYASYGIDQIASEQEATGWQTFNDGLNGELYWEVNNPPSQSITTTDGLTGDGTLFYPYDATLVGGTHSIPLESIRLKRIRDGQQDYELLHLATAEGLSLPDGRTAHTIASTLFPSLSASAVTATALDTAEQDVFRLFSTATVAPAINPNDLDCSGTPDFLAVGGTGNLLYYPRAQTDWEPNVPVTVGSGYGTTAAGLTYTNLLLPGDLNGDGSPDLLGRKADGSMWLMPGNCTGTFGTAVKLTSTTTAPVAVGDFNGDGHPDLLDKHADGTLWMLAGTGSGGFNAPVQVGAGWGQLQITAAGDFNKDGAVDVIARQTNGALLLYEGNGTGGWKTTTGGISLGLTLPLATYPQLFGVGDLSGDGDADLVAIDSSGTMWRYNGNGATSLATTPTRIGGGWNAPNLIEVADGVAVQAQAPPTITAVSPNSGSTAGGTTVTITGTGFTGATNVLFSASTAATSFTVVSSTQITAVSPPEPAATKNIFVITPGGTSAVVTADQFTFTAPPPTITAVSPNSGTTAGGTTVTITGTGFTGATHVLFSASTAATSFTVVSSTQITAVSPPEPAATKNIFVVTPGGTSAVVAADQFTFKPPPPTITGVSPNSGTTAGGTTVTITGTGFTGATHVLFNASTAATSFTVVSSTEITAVSPAEPAATKNIFVVTPGGTSAVVAADQFTFK